MKLRSKLTKPPRIEMMPLIDIVFLLLIFFIFAMLSMSVQQGRQVDLPVSDNARQKPATPISLTLQDKNGTILFFLDTEQIQAEQLIASLQQELQRQKKEGLEESIQLLADKNLPYQQIYSTLDKINQAGFSQILLQSRPEGQVQQ